MRANAKTSSIEMKTAGNIDKTVWHVDIDMLWIFFVASLKETESNPILTSLMDKASVILFFSVLASANYCKEKKSIKKPVDYTQ